jgi:radical SAM superfamily enzyme YgiQ (UPF0313 family)
MRMVEASLRASGIDDLELRVWDLHVSDLDVLITELLSFDPDVIGFSSYLWSFPFFVEVARQLKADDPGRLTVFGGPAARGSMMKLKPYRNAHEFIDVLVINEGEVTFVNIIKLQERTHSKLNKLAGISLYKDKDWADTPAQPQSDLNELPSPYQMDLVPEGGIGVLQTYRGCPFTCSFCEWGVLKSPKRVCEVDTLSAELDALARNGVTGTLLVDAGLNLNRLAFKNLSEACKETGFYDNRYLISEIYPAKVTQEHIDFLQGISRPLVGVGLQSFDNEVLSHVNRAYDEKRFENTLTQLMDVSTVAIEIIMGLPGDSPEKFRRSFERARKLPCALRVYHCVVLPSALMIKSPPSDRLKFDPWTLKMQSCLGWSAAGLQSEVDFVTRRAEQEDGQTGEYFWVFSPPQ